MTKVIFGLIDQPNKNGDLFTTEAINRALANSSPNIPVYANTDWHETVPQGMASNLRVDGSKLMADISLNDKCSESFRNILNGEAEFWLMGFGDLDGSGKYKNFSISGISANEGSNPA